jgi:hypothetical protein
VCQVRIKKMNESERSMTYRKAIQSTSKPDGVINPGGIQTIPVYGLDGVRCRGCMILIQAPVWNVGTCRFSAKGKGIGSETSSTEANRRGGVARSSVEVRESGWSKGATLFNLNFWSTKDGRNQKRW